MKKGSDATLSCVITGAASKVKVKWLSGTAELESNDNFTPTEGTYSDGKQTSTLTVKGSQVSTDTTYTCRVTSGEYPNSGYRDKTVNLNVYGRFRLEIFA